MHFIYSPKQHPGKPLNIVHGKRARLLSENGKHTYCTKKSYDMHGASSKDELKNLLADERRWQVHRNVHINFV